MIIDDKHEIAFVHIPKCAGTTVREYLKEYDRSQGFFSDRVDMHEKLGMLDFVHIPLYILKEHFPTELELIHRYWSFAVMRDPYKRFASSVTQRLRMYGEKPIEALSEREIRSEVENCIALLEKYEDPQVLLPHDYIHFQRQIDYIYLGDELLIDNIYSSEMVGDLVDILKERLGCSLDAVGESTESETRLNSTVVYRSDVVRFFMGFSKPMFRIFFSWLPQGAREAVKRGVYVDRDQKVGGVFASKNVVDFIGRYYREDILLYERVKCGCQDARQLGSAV
ncbi:sulfotransferase family 2 domain-containing protein [Alcanivorax borkumensis]|uniref:Sulfotransferase family protein n=1 Tax=Alcanivorax borkumensis (strain ATCC 700651 / DSM 11573 / NCIMB 13689 / SK2) TaxID=393595 RepID=Q0VR34_ALCBS|nr:sulfotransferase family 2 domain-containing protein [Alcanivorax borkumensis]CAL16364.1 hypothetical protein ABO_0916 [Alcanivorax borkumensis SK2]